MKRKIFALGLFAMLTVTFATLFNTGSNVSASTDSTANKTLTELVTEYRNGGVYTKKSNIYLTETAENELSTYFHGDVAQNRTTYYSGEYLLMGNLDGTFAELDSDNNPVDGINSGYRTEGNDMKHFVYKNGAVEDTYTVNGTKLHSFYVTLDKLVVENYFDATWSYGTHVVSGINDEYLEDFLAFAAPCLTEYILETNYLTSNGILLSISEEENTYHGKYLAFQIYVTSLDKGKVNDKTLLAESRVYKGNTSFDESVNPNPKALTREEFLSQVALYGNSTGTDIYRARIAFSIKMEKGTKIEFIGDSSVYGWAVCEAQQTTFRNYNGIIDSDWLTSKTYELKADSYPIIIMKRSNPSSFTGVDLMSVHSLFKITGNKVNVYDNKEISVEEFNEQVIAMGNLANSTSTENSTNSKRASIYFSLKMNAGTKITFTGDSSVYNWAVVETYNNSFTSRVGETFSENRLDSGWNTSSSFTGTSKTEYYTQLHGGYIVITLKRVDGAAFSGDYSQLAKFHSMFKIEGIKYSDDAYLPQTEYGVKTVAHRGYSYYAPENTLSAYDYAAKAGFRYVECDVYFTKDNIPVLLHDSSIDRTSSGTGNIADLTYEEASQYDYGSWKGSQFAGEKLPTFEEFVILCRKLNLHPYIEIKGTITAEQANTLVGIVNKYHLSSDSSWISFDLIALEQIKLLDECARLGYVVSPISEAKIAEAVTLKTGKNEVFMDAYYTNATAANATLCKNNGLAFEVWTVNTITNFLSVDSYVTGFTTNMINVGFQKEVRK